MSLKMKENRNSRFTLDSQHRQAYNPIQSDNSGSRQEGAMQFTTHGFYGRLLCALVATMFVAGVQHVSGQAFVNGSVVGNVNDNTGAGVPAVEMMLTNLDTSSRLRVQTDS